MIDSTHRDHGGLLARIIRLSSNNPVTTLVITAALACLGWFSMLNTPIDAVPDLSDPQVVVYTDWAGRSPDQVEDQITFPLSSRLLSTPGVETVRGQSFFGLSLVYVIFDDSVDPYWARTRVLEAMTAAERSLPSGVSPTLGPDATGVGWVYMYALTDTSGNNDLSDLRQLQDWELKFALESVPGVAEVASLGGFVKQYQVIIDPSKLIAYGVTLDEVAASIQASNQETGGRVIEIAGHEHMIRGEGEIGSLDDLRGVLLKVNSEGAPVTIGDIAEVAFGPEMRRGIAELNGEGEVVGGIVVMRQGENALTVINAIKERISDLETSLPEGVEIVTTYDRSGLITGAIDTLKETLIEEVLVVSIIVMLFLLHFSSSIVAVVTLPIAILLAFIPLRLQGFSANIMSLGGIAVAIGAMVDGSIIIVENVHQKLAKWRDDGKIEDKRRVITEAMVEVGPAIFFSLLVITVSFLPVFTLQATEGRLFKPLAWTKTWAMACGAILAVTATPALASILLGRAKSSPKSERFSNLLTSLYAPVVRWSLRHKRLVIGIALALLATTVPIWRGLGSEFMPPLNEGAILHMPSAPPGMSIGQSSAVLQVMDRKILEIPEVESVFGKMGRADTATDPAPLGMAETTITLKPREQWREGLTWQDLINELDAAVQTPGMPNIWWMPIQTRTEMLSTGVRSPLAIQLFGPDMESIERAGVEIERILKAEIPEARSVFAERSTGGFYLDIRTNQSEAARYGLRSSDVMHHVQVAIGGDPVDEVIEGRARFSIQVRYAREFRENPEAIENLLIQTPTGATIPLSRVADIEFTNGPPMIRTEEGQISGFVFVDPGEVVISDYVERGQAAIDGHLSMPEGVRMEWTGQYKYMQRAHDRLTFVIPITLALVMLLLYLNTRSWVEAFIVILAVPMSLIGAIWLLHILNFQMSVAVWVGLIALAGLDAETGVVMLLYLKLAHKRAIESGGEMTPARLEEAIVEGAAKRIRPKLMTVITTGCGLLPLMWSTGPGADAMRRIAAPMVGGLGSSFMLELLIYPVIYAIWKGRALKQPS